MHIFKSFTRTCELIKDLKRRGVEVLTTKELTKEYLEFLLKTTENRTVTVYFADGTRLVVGRDSQPQTTYFYDGEGE